MRTTGDIEHELTQCRAKLEEEHSRLLASRVLVDALTQRAEKAEAERDLARATALELTTCDDVLHLAESLAKVSMENQQLRAELKAAVEREKRAEAACAEMRELLRREADAAYVQGCNVTKQPECLGAEYKISRGLFGQAELKAHCLAHEFFGFHKLAYQLLNELPNWGKVEAAAEPQPEVGIPATVLPPMKEGEL